MSIIVIILLSIIFILILMKKSNNIEREKELKIALFKLTHEIKNPLTVCKGYLDMIDYNNKDNVINYLNIIKSELDRTVLIINEFSDYGKLTINKDIVELSLLLDEIYKTITPLIEKYNINISFDNIEDEVYVEIDYLKIKQVLINILKNAIEARKKDENMNLKVKVYINNNYINIDIIDDGIGMNKETLSKISEVFYTTKQNGTGLGVGLSKEIIKLHNGSLKYKSKLGIGTTVMIKLPVK